MLSGHQKLLGGLLVGTTAILVGYAVSRSFASGAPANSVALAADTGAETPAASTDATNLDPTLGTPPPAIASPSDASATGGASAVAVSNANEKPKTRVYTVQANDSFWTITHKVYGDYKYMNLLTTANASHKVLRSGMRIICPPFEGSTYKLELPGLDDPTTPATNAITAPAGGATAISSGTSEAENIDTASGDISLGTPGSAAIATTPVAVAAATPRSHTVQSGENLYDIAKKYYKNGAAWTKIAAANPNINAKAIKPGQVLQIP